MSRAFELQGESRQVDARWDGTSLRWSSNGTEPETLGLRQIDDTTLLLEAEGHQRRVRFARSGSDVYLLLDGHTLHVRAVGEDDDRGVVGGAGDPVVRAPMPGKVVAILVAPGDAVEAGVAVARVEAMKMEVDLPAPFAGTVATVHASGGDLVEPDAPLVTLEPADES